LFHDGSDYIPFSTERTYVKGLQELIDIYIKPASAPVILLGGVSSTKETVIPASERKIVFSGLDSLFSFHKDIFLPALELAANPVLRPQAKQSEQEMEGVLSANAARGIARTFVSHAAFMRMYSTYIK
jgi:RhoGEF domain